LSHTVTKVRHATSHVEDPCLSVESHSAAAFTIVFDHTSLTGNESIAVLILNFGTKWG